MYTSTFAVCCLSKWQINNERMELTRFIFAQTFCSIKDSDGRSTTIRKTLSKSDSLIHSSTTQWTRWCARLVSSSTASTEIEASPWRCWRQGMCLEKWLVFKLAQMSSRVLARSEQRQRSASKRVSVSNIATFRSWPATVTIRILKMNTWRSWARSSTELSSPTDDRCNWQANATFHI